MKLSEKGPITQVRLVFDGSGTINTVNINDEVTQLEAELHNAQVRISDRDLKTERQKGQLNKLEASRKGLKTENATLKREKERMMRLAHDYITAYEKLAFGDALLTGESDG